MQRLHARICDKEFLCKYEGLNHKFVRGEVDSERFLADQCVHLIKRSLTYMSQQ